MWPCTLVTAGAVWDAGGDLEDLLPKQLCSGASKRRRAAGSATAAGMVGAEAGPVPGSGTAAGACSKECLPNMFLRMSGANARAGEAAATGVWIWGVTERTRGGTDGTLVVSGASPKLVDVERPVEGGGPVVAET